MLRKLALWLLILPMPLNGLWMVCKDAPSEAPRPAQSSSADQPDDCTKICARKHQQAAGAICIISPGDKSSINITVFGVAVLPAEFRLIAPPSCVDSRAEFTKIYL